MPGEPIPVTSEEEIFELIDMDYKQPHERNLWTHCWNRVQIMDKIGTSDSLPVGEIDVLIKAWNVSKNNPACERKVEVVGCFFQNRWEMSYPCKRHEVFLQQIFNFSGWDMPTVKLFGRTPGTRDITWNASIASSSAVHVSPWVNGDIV